MKMMTCLPTVMMLTLPWRPSYAGATDDHGYSLVSNYYETIRVDGIQFYRATNKGVKKLLAEDFIPEVAEFISYLMTGYYPIK